jgi:hypothetical protein
MSNEQPIAEGPTDDSDRLVQRIVDRISPDDRFLRVEFLAVVVLAIAGVLTAWAALQSAKWSGEQAIHFSEAGANRSESTRLDGRAAALVVLDAQAFFQWGQASQSEAIEAGLAGTEPPDPTVYDPNNPTLSGYFFAIFREEFIPRVRTWLDGGGPSNPIGTSPFVPYEEYLAESVPQAAEATGLSQIADEKATEARSDNQNSDNYVFTVVILASVLFFAGVSTKMRSHASQNFMVILAIVLLAWAVVRLMVLPIHPIP